MSELNTIDTKPVGYAPPERGLKWETIGNEEKFATLTQRAKCASGWVVRSMNESTGEMSPPVYIQDKAGEWVPDIKWVVTNSADPRTGAWDDYTAVFNGWLVRQGNTKRHTVVSMVYVPDKEGRWS